MAETPHQPMDFSSKVQMLEVSPRGVDHASQIHRMQNLHSGAVRERRQAAKMNTQASAMSAT
jgi:hypothetical protein